MERKEDQKAKLKSFFDDIVSSDLVYNKGIADIDYTVLMKSLSCGKAIKALGCTVSAFNYVFEGDPAILAIFSYFPKEDSGSKHMSEKIIEVINLMQEIFVTLDYIDVVKPKSEGYVYIVSVKKISKGESGYERSES